MKKPLAFLSCLALFGLASPGLDAGEACLFHPKDAAVRDAQGQRFVWCDACGNTLPDHQLGGGFEWERDSRSYIALGEAWVRGQRRPGLVMLSFPDGNVLQAEWKASYPKGASWRLQYALTDEAARSSSNGLKFTVVATDDQGTEHKLVERTLAAGDQKVYDEALRFDYAVRSIRFVHDNLGKEMWDVLWLHPQGLVCPPLPAASAVKSPARPPAGWQSAGGYSPASAACLRQAIEDLCATFGERYPKGAEFLARLSDLEKRPPGAERTTEFESLRREALVANPLVSGQPMIFCVHAQYIASYHAIDTLSQCGEASDGKYHRGGALKALDPRTGQVKTLVEAPQGVVRSPCVSFDAKKILFAMRREPKENLHLFEINSDGSGLKQLTFAPGVSDFDPLYLPDGSIVFSSTREPKYNMCSQDVGANLFRIEADGANIHQITKSTLFENHAALMPDGRILYKRWEYVDRNFGDAHGFWSVNPDGTNQATVYGNSTADPAAVYYGQPIPGTGRLLCTLSTHHHNMWGPLGILEPRIATDGKAAIARTWPAGVRDWLRDGDAFDCDRLNPIQPKYESPWPLSDRHFLVSRMTGKGSELGIYLVDTFGNEVLLHAEPPSCFSPMPLAPRPKPPLPPSRRDFEGKEGYLYVQDVYFGSHMQGVKPGTVKKIRVVESPEKRGWTPAKWYGQGFMAPGMNWHDFTAKRILGTVPVEADGSAYFAVPSDTFIFFQLLDENDMMVHSMRSGTVLQSGERTGCVGCHERRHEAPRAGQTPPLALRREPSRIEPWYGQPRVFNYLAEVQPVFDRHCVKCHDFGGKGGEKLVLAGDKDPFFNASYTQLWRKGYIKAVGAGPANIQQPYSWGSHPSRIVQQILKGHNDVKLSKEDFDRVVTWIDINAPYYPSYYSAYPDNLGGRCPLYGGQMARLAALTGVNWQREDNFASSTGPWVSFDRPEVSPCLGKLAKDGPQYKEALAIIQAGKDFLAKRPRADMPGFIPCEKDQRREAFYQECLQAERQRRDAIRKGERVYDKPSPPQVTSTRSQ
ncbi:MAG: hypothetical protein FJ290_04105 [Planctomycetes bacterium]|nr:hypothetical protein [Planctomycetota bacterium]